MRRATAPTTANATVMAPHSFQFSDLLPATAVTIGAMAHIAATTAMAADSPAKGESAAMSTTPAVGCVGSK